MESYKNSSGNSGVSAFEIQEKSILVEFNHDRIYRYNYSSAGKEHVENMKKLAQEGKGLSTYISQNVKEKYAAVFPSGR